MSSAPVARSTLKITTICVTDIRSIICFIIFGLQGVAGLSRWSVIMFFVQKYFEKAVSGRKDKVSEDKRRLFVSVWPSRQVCSVKRLEFTEYATGTFTEENPSASLCIRLFEMILTVRLLRRAHGRDRFICLYFFAINQAFLLPSVLAGNYFEIFTNGRVFFCVFCFQLCPFQGTADDSHRHRLANMSKICLIHTTALHILHIPFIFSRSLPLSDE